MDFKKVLLTTAAAFIAVAAVAGNKPNKNVPVRTDVPNKAFFKDLFVDSSIKIVQHDTLYAADWLGLSQETLRLEEEDTPENTGIEQMMLKGSAEDLNGRLLYPDGEPRFSCIYMYGGQSNNHGVIMGTAARERYRTFLTNGGSYVGSCAGAYICCLGCDTQGSRPGYIGMWPGICNEAAITGIWPAYVIPEGSPLLRYSSDSFGGDLRVEKIEHYNGPYFSTWATVPGTEVLAYNDIKDCILDGQPSLIAYKSDAFSGRLLISGGHPELEAQGEQLFLMSSMLRYAIDGRGCAKVKAVLENGESRAMTKGTLDNDPLHTMVGDLQCHNFAFSLPPKARNVKVRLEVLSNHNLSLRLAKGTYAFREDARYASENKELVKELSFDRLDAGVWYIGVQCEDTVTVKHSKEYDVYENTEVLNGVPYKISVSWDVAKVGDAVLQRGADINEKIKMLVSGENYKRNWDADSTVTSIVFKGGCRKVKNGVRLDHELSEEPVYLSYDGAGTVTISTPAAKFRTCGVLNYLFENFKALKKVDGFELIDLEGCIDAGEAAPKLP